MELTRIRDRNKLAAYFRRDLPTHAYCLGDLDDMFWPHTSYYGATRQESLSHVTLLYRGAGLPVLLALGPEGVFGKEYYLALSPLLPDHFYAHLSPGVEKLFRGDYQIREYGCHYKMSLVKPEALGNKTPEGPFRLGASDLTELQQLYQASYPDNAFDSRMLETGKYFGCRSGSKLVSAAGVHVYSPTFRVAALGNITTHPDYRNQGFARQVTTRLCLDLAEEVDHLGLNVKADNAPAIHLYQSLGFKIAANYGEFSLKKRV